MHRQPVGRTLIALAASAWICAACGGGGGGGGGATPPAGDEPAPAPAEGAPATYTLSGEIQAAAATAIDGDVNDPGAAYVPNDTLLTAQPLPNPVTLGGYVNQPASGAPGRSQANGDVRDYFRIELAQGQVVRLFPSGDGAADDADLSLLDVDGQLVALSNGDNAVEEIAVPASGEYLIEVLAFTGASSYVLSVGQGAAATAAPAAEYVPGELVVRFADAGDSLAMEERLESMAMNWAGGRPDETMLLSCDTMPQRDEAFESLGMDHLLTDDPTLRGLDPEAQLRHDTPRLAKAMRRRSDVQSADLNYIRQPLAAPADQFYPLQWHYPQINLPQAWDAVQPQSGVVVAVIDTGIVAHPDLAGQTVPGYDFVRDVANAGDGNGCDPDPTDPGDGAVGGSTFHGTHVAGTIAARTSLQADANAEGVAGVAWNARVMPLRGLGVAGGTDFDIMAAIRYAAGLVNVCNALPAAPARIVNMSLGGPGESAAFAAVVAEARAAGLILVAAAGNDGNTTPLYPASFPGVISVSAVDINKGLASYSSYGNTIDVTAPGGDVGDLNGDGYLDGVLSTIFDDRVGQNEYAYAFSIGTSMASPHVAGVLALMLGVNPALTPTDIDSLLQMGKLTEDLGDAFRFGYGLIDAQAAVAAALEAAGGVPPVNPALLGVDPTAMNFGALGTEATLTASNVGGTDGVALTIASVTAMTDDGAPWLGVAPVSVDAAGLGGYRVTVDRGQVNAFGLYTGRIVLDSSLNDLEVMVIMQVAAQVASDDAGHHHVLLLDAQTLAPIAAIEANAQNGAYAYQFSGVEAGSYRIVAGTDSDNDGSVCDAGEACGAYPTRDDLGVIDVTADRAGLDFSTGFPSSLATQGVRPDPTRGFPRR